MTRMLPKLAVLLAVTGVSVCCAADKPVKLGFGTPSTGGKTSGFNKGATTGTKSPRSSERDQKYARDLLSKYDTDGNRVLDPKEWRRISGNPEKADTNGDKKITFDELVARVSKRRRDKEASKKKPKASDLKSYRVQTPQDKLPEGLPSWFRQKDTNRDGQVAMHEYSRRWTDSTARKFVALDKNDDGLITPDEAKR